MGKCNCGTVGRKEGSVCTVHNEPFRGVLESEIQAKIIARLGSNRGLRLYRNAIDQRTFHCGLGKGTPDLVGILAPHGRMFALEVKRPGEKATEDQSRVHRVWREFGAFVAVVCSVEEAEAALERANNGESE